MLACLVAATFLALVNYAALLPVVPLWAVAGGASSVAVGALTGGMMAATVAAQVVMPWLMRRMSLRSLMVLGALLMGAPTPAYLLSHEFAWVMLLTLVRGAGFGIVVVTGGILAAESAPPHRLASSVAVYGFATASPTVVGLAGGLWGVERAGFGTVFCVAAGSAIAGALVACLLPGDLRGRFSMAGVRGAAAAAGPICLLVLSGGAFGAVTTFLPITASDPGAAALALLAAGLALVAGRVGAGPLGDRVGSGRLQAWAAGICACGLALLAVALDGPALALVLGGVMLGAGFGACQNDTFVETVRRMRAHGSGTASTVWNIGYDGGLGLGAFAIGAVIGALGARASLLAMAVAILTGALVVGLRAAGAHRSPGRRR